MLPYHNSCYAMGTRLNVIIVEPLLDCDLIFDEIVREVDRLEAKLSRFSESSDVYWINQNAGYRSIQIDAEMGNILSLCIDYYERAHGAFDITLPSKSHTRKTYRAPASQKYSRLSDDILFDSERLTVAFPNSSIQLDLGGFGKGYAMQKIKSILKENSVQNALVSFGESSILATGRHPYGDCWKIGIENSWHFTRSPCVFELTDQSISTSGFQRRTDGTVGYHIINPLTLRPVKATSSITVQSSDPLEAEILSTALFASLDADTAFLDNFSDYHILRINYNEDQLMES